MIKRLHEGFDASGSLLYVQAELIWKKFWSVNYNSSDPQIWTQRRLYKKSKLYVFAPNEAALY